MKKIIEFVYQSGKNIYLPNLVSLDIEDISVFYQIDEYGCKILTKNNQTFSVFGTYRSICNRIAYTIEKELNYSEDIIIRPSILLEHKLHKLEISSVLLDASQAKAFIDAYYKNKDPSFLYQDLLDDTRENIERLPVNFWHGIAEITK